MSRSWRFTTVQLYHTTNTHWVGSLIIIPISPSQLELGKCTFLYSCDIMDTDIGTFTSVSIEKHKSFLSNKSKRTREWDDLYLTSSQVNTARQTFDPLLVASSEQAEGSLYINTVHEMLRMMTMTLIFMHVSWFPLCSPISRKVSTEPWLHYTCKPADLQKWLFSGTPWGEEGAGSHSEMIKIKN